MSAVLNQQQRIFRAQPNAASLAVLLLDPVVAIGSLIAVALAYGEQVSGPLVILSLIVFGLTFPGRAQLDATLRSMYRDLILGWSLILGSLFFFGYATGYIDIFPRDLVFEWAVMVPLSVLIAHHLARAVIPKLVLTQQQRLAAIVGANELGLKLAWKIKRTPLARIRVVGFFDDRSFERLQRVKPERLCGGLASLAEFVRQHRIDQIYLTLPLTSQPRILRLLEDLRDTTASIYFVPDIFVIDLIQARMDAVGGIPVVAVCDTPFTGINGLAKRISDIVLTLLILLVISPVMLAIAVGVKLSSPGPALFRQRRYGLDGQEITVLKFRSMTVCEDGMSVPQAVRDDPRVTRFGALIRRTSLDELPQFLNVLQGTMSIVGPRPHAVVHNELYRKLISGYMIRHKVKPGITGWAQVHGYRGETESVHKMKKRIDYDLDYLRNWSLRLDLLIIMRTVVMVFRDRRAY